MNKPKVDRSEVRETTFTVTVTRDEKNAIREQAKKIGLTMSSWARMVLAEKINQK